MNTRNQDRHNAYWASIPGSDELLAIYGYYPTFHDASAVAFVYDGSAKELTISFEYWDEAENKIDDAKGKLKITLRWIGVSSVDLNSYGTDVSNVNFSPDGDDLLTTLPENWGLYGTIRSKAVEILSVEDSACDSTEYSESYLNTMGLRIRS